MKKTMVGLAMVAAAVLIGGCAALDKGYDTEVTWSEGERVAGAV